MSQQITIQPNDEFQLTITGADYAAIDAKQSRNYRMK